MGPSLRRIREALELRVEQTSLRSTAREVGLSPSGLRKFLDGANPYSPTELKLQRWYVRETRPDYGSALTAAGAENALRILTQDIPSSRRDEVVERIHRVLLEEYEQEGRRPPEWLRSARGS